MYTGSVSSVEEYISRLFSFPFLMKPSSSSGVWERMPTGVTFSDYCDVHGPDWSSFLAHEHYIWHSARPRYKQGTIELRSACQQPWDSHLSVAALSLGLVEGSKIIEDKIVNGFHKGDIEAAWRAMHIWHRHAIYKGLSPLDSMQQVLSSPVALSERICGLVDKKDVEGLGSLLQEVELSVPQVTSIIMIAMQQSHGSVKEREKRICDALRVFNLPMIADSEQYPSSVVDPYDMLRVILDTCREVVSKRDMGEEVYLEPLFERLEKRENPAQEAIRVAKRGGMEALIKHTAINK